MAATVLACSRDTQHTKEYTKEGEDAPRRTTHPLAGPRAVSMVRFEAKIFILIFPAALRYYLMVF